MSFEWKQWRDIPTKSEWEDATPDNWRHHRGYRLNRLSERLDIWHASQDKPTAEKTMKLMDLDDAIVEWVATDPKESKNRNGGREVNLKNPQTAPAGPVDKLFALMRTKMENLYPGKAEKFCVFNIGTAHSREEDDNIMVQLFQAAGGIHGRSGQAVHLNHGPGPTGDLAGGIFGHGLARRRRLTVKRIQLAEPSEVYIIGHSRGAVLSYLIANDLEQQGVTARVHIFNLDPVAMTTSGGGDRNTLSNNVVEHVIMTMENETSNIFPLTLAKGGKFEGATPYMRHRNPDNVTQVIAMPGTHGSGTQTKTSIGRLSLSMAKEWLAKHQVNLGGPPPAPQTIMDQLFRIHHENPVSFDYSLKKMKGLYTEVRDVRHVQDGDKFEPKVFGRKRLQNLPQHYGNKGDRGGIELTRLSEWQATPFFINHYHEALFASMFPTVHKTLCTGRPGMARRAPSSNFHDVVNVLGKQQAQDREWQQRLAKLGVSVTAREDQFRAQLQQARAIPEAERVFKNLGLV